MFKHIFLFILTLVLGMQILSASPDKNRIEIKAKHIELENDIVTAKDNVVVYYGDAVIKASSASFNRKTKLLVLDGDIVLMGYQGGKEHADHMEIQTDTKEVKFEELFLVSENDVWIYSDDVNKKEGKYNLGTSVLSSCDISDPLWTMVFSEAEYNTNENHMQVYHAKVYMWDVPVFYSPYLSFSTNKERSSGLLFPGLGYTENEGFLYEQPIYWAISESMDLEINPQIRTDRSLGVYGTFRFVDSNHSSGKIRVGYFKDKESYTQEYGLLNDDHYGIEFNYESSKVFEKYLPDGFDDGLYVNTTYLNDIDYLYLQRTNLNHFGFSPIQQSRINYFAQNNDYYMGINAKYFIDTRKTDNDTTIQELPSIQLHKYLDHFITENFTYSVDLHINNLDRKEGATMRQAELKIPLEFTTSFFDDFVSLSLGEELYYSKFFFGNGTFVHDDYSYYSNIHKVKLFSDLTKRYDNFVHIMQPSLGYIKPGSENESPIEFSLLSDEQKELFAVGLPEEKFDFSLSQYFYDDNMKLRFFQRLSQRYYPEREYELADLNNEMQYNWDKISLYNNLVYAYEFSEIRESSSYMSMRGSDYSLTLGHSYIQVLPDLPAARAINDVAFSFAYSYNEKIKFNGALTYNIDDSIDDIGSKQWRLGGGYHRDCWSVSAWISQYIIPTSAGATSIDRFYMQLNFTPFGSIGTGDLGQPQQ